MKQLLLVVILLLDLSGVQAQTTERQDAVGRFRFVPSVMITYNPYSIKDWMNNSVSCNHRFQLGFGVEAEYRLHEFVGVAFGCDYVVQGVKTSEYRGSYSYIGSYNKNEEHEVKLKSLCVPLLVCLHPLPNDRMALKFGYQMDFLLGMGDNYKKICHDVPMSIAYSFDDRLQLELRYNIGVSDIFKEKGTSVTRDCYILSAGVRF